jgi:Predicted endonuclease containing a URI domain
LYTGIARDVNARVTQHNQGRGARYTRGRGPVAIVHVERKRSQGSALRREAAIKALPRKAKLALASEAALA